MVDFVTSGDPVLDQQRTAMRELVDAWSHANRRAKRARAELYRFGVLMAVVGGSLGAVVGWVARLFFVG